METETRRAQEAAREDRRARRFTPEPCRQTGREGRHSRTVVALELKNVKRQLQAACETASGDKVVGDLEEHRSVCAQMATPSSLAWPSSASVRSMSSSKHRKDLPTADWLCHTVPLSCLLSEISTLELSLPKERMLKIDPEDRHPKDATSEDPQGSNPHRVSLLVEGALLSSHTTASSHSGQCHHTFLPGTGGTFRAESELCGGFAFSTTVL